MSVKTTTIPTIILFFLLSFVTNHSIKIVTNEKLQGTTPTPQPFLGPIFYQREDVWQVFDHNLPLGGSGNDGNNFVVHYDGTQHNPVTITPMPSASPTPNGTPPPSPYIPGGYGYDQHGGIDYSLQYKPVLAAANGTVHYAGWSNPSNHREGYGLTPNVRLFLN